MSGTQPPPPTDGESRFRRVLQQFKDEHLKGSECDQFQFTNLGDLKSSMREIQDEQASKAKMRNMNRLRKFLEGMEQYEKLIEMFLNASEYVAFVWGPMKFLLQVTRNYVRAFDALLDHYEDMGEQLEVLAHHQSLFELKENGHLNTVLEMIFSDILDFHAKALSYFRQKIWRTFFDATWNNFRSCFSEPMNNLRRHRKILENYAQLTTLERISALSNDQTEALKLQRLEANRQQRDRVRAWLSPEDMMADQERYMQLRREYPGTGGWILRKNLVMTWLDLSTNVNPVLWLTGIPGAGKTILASIIIEAAWKLSAAKVAFVYCKDGHQNRNNFLSVAKNVLYQLSQNNDRLIEYIDAVMSKEGQTTLQRAELAKDLLRAVVHGHDNVFIVVDGLDECLKQEKKGIFSWIQSIVGLDPEPRPGQPGTADQTDDVEPTLVRCLLVSQEDSVSSRLLNGYPVLRILSADNSADIKTYCEAWEFKIRCKHSSIKFNSDSDSITSNVLKRADGMFQFARLVMMNLNAQSRAFRLQEELNWLREGNEKQGVLDKLDEAYGRILRSMEREMEAERYRDAMQILSWVVIARRDLRWHEIQGASSLDLKNRVVDFEGRRFSDEDGPKDLCGSLLEVTQGGVVMLVHSTAGLFLTKYHVNVAAAHLSTATICLSYLSAGHVDTSLSSETVEANVMNGCYAFFDYAASHWLDHLTISVSNPKTADASSVDRLSGEIRHFLRRHFETVDPKRVPPGFNKGFDPSLLFGSEGFLDALTQAAYSWSLLLNKRSSIRKEQTGGKNNRDLDQVSGLERFILQLRLSLDNAARKLKGSTELERLEQYHGPGLFKCRFVHCDYFHIGFAEKAARDSHQNKHDHAFFCVFDDCSYGITGFASSGSLEDHVRNAHSTGTANPVYEPQFPILDDPKRINEREAARSGNFAAIQRWAEQFNGPIPLARIGLKKRVPYGVNAFSLDTYSTFGIIWKTRRFDILKWLVEKSDDVELAKIASLRWSWARSRWPECEEWIFSAPTKLADVRLLYHTLDRHLPARDETLCLRVLRHYHRSASRPPTGKISLLRLMAKHGFLSCIRFLVLECGSDANYNYYGRTVLLNAAERGREDIVRFFLEGKHCTQTTIDYVPKKKPPADAATLAAANGYESIVQAMASYVAPRRLETALRVAHFRQAAMDGDNEVISKLLNAGIPIDLPDSDGYTPFLNAVERNKKETVKLLLGQARKRISINQKCASHHPALSFEKKEMRKHGLTALIIACANGYKEIVKLLVECDGIDTKATTLIKSSYVRARGLRVKGTGYLTASMIADVFGFETIKKLLKQREELRNAPPHSAEGPEEEITGGSEDEEGSPDTSELGSSEVGEGEVLM